jgi:hypothetical protein
MGIVDDVAEELDGLIDRVGGITAENLARCPKVTALLAHGDAEQAFLVIEGIRRRNRNRYVAAAFAHIGGFGYRGNTEDRLNQFAIDYHATVRKGAEPPSSRTVRRWSDSGQRILADAIVRSSGIEPPTAHLDVLRGNESTLIVLPTIYHMHGYVMNDPLLIVVGAETHAVHAFVPEQMEALSANAFQPRDAVEVDVGFPVHIQLVWQGEVQPSVVTRTINFPADLIEMCSMTAGASGLAIYREGDAIDELAELAAELGRLQADAATELP